MNRRLIFELDARELRVRSSLPTTRGPYIWPRAQITEIKLNRSDGKLLIRAMGQEMVNLYTGPRIEVTEWLAQRLTEALHAPVEPVVELPPLSPPEGAPHISRRGRAILLYIWAFMIVAGVVMTFLGFPWVVIGLYVVILACAPVGIALGTQEKEFYL